MADKVSPIEALPPASREWGEIETRLRQPPLGDGGGPGALHRLLVVLRDLQVRERRAAGHVVEPHRHRRRRARHAARGERRAGDALAAARLPALREPGLHQGVPRAGHVPARGRPRDAGPAALHRLPVLHGGLPLRRAHVQLGQARPARRTSTPAWCRRGPSAPWRSAPSACTASPTGRCRRASGPARPRRASSATSTTRTAA